MSQSRQFILKQTATLLKLGVNPIDVERTIKWVDAHLPEGANPATWIPSAQDLNDGYVSEAAVLDARTAFYMDEDIPERFRRILDARAVE